MGKFIMRKSYIEDLLTQHKLQWISGDYIDACKPTLKCMDTNGYLFNIQLNSLQGGHIPSPFHKNNPYTLYNISVWAYKNSVYKLIDGQHYVGNKQKLKWICPKCGEFEMNWHKAQNNQSCPVCCGRQVNSSNSLTTLRPDLIEYFMDKNICNNITIHSEKSVNIRCINCGYEKTSPVCNLTKSGFCCPICSDGVPLPEKFVNNLLKSLNVKFISQYCPTWSSNKRYDAFVEDFLILEIHGLQHYEQSPRGRSLEEEQENDLHKYNLAIQNCVKLEDYVVIDCRYSTFEHLKENCIKQLFCHFDLSNVDWSEVWLKSQNNLCTEAWEWWNNGMHSVSEISKEIGVEKTTVRKYLKIGSNVGKCEYIPKEMLRKNGAQNGKKSAVPIAQYTMDDDFIQYWESATTAARELKLSQPSISRCARGERNSYSGFKWKLKFKNKRRDI